MKALTLYQPWAQLVVDKNKLIETRSWRTHHRGDLLIHAGKTFHFSDLELCHQEKHFARCIPDPTKLITGALLGVVEVKDCIRMAGVIDINYQLLHWVDQSKIEQERTFGHYDEGRYMWILGNVRKFEKPIYGVSGAQGLWDYNIDLSKQKFI